MATLSGRTGYAWMSNHTRFWVEWTGSQDIANNKTTITAKAYIEAVDGYGAIYSSAQKDGGIEIVDKGTSHWYYFTVSSGALSNYQKKLLFTKTYTVTHNSDGTANIGIDGFYDIEVTFAGTYYGRLDVAQDDATLPTIPRASSLATSENWTAGQSLGVSVNRASTSFTHKFRVYAKNPDGSWNWIKEVSGIPHTTTISFSQAENTDIFNSLAGRSSCESRILVDTYNGSTPIGDTEYNYGTISSPSCNYTSWSGDFNIGDTITGTVTKRTSYLTHKIFLEFGGTSYALTGETGSTSWSYDTDGIASALYGKIPNAKYIDGKIRILSYYNGVQVYGKGESTIRATVVNSEPKFLDTYIAYKDIKTETVNLTGDDQKIIQNQSDFRAFINTPAEPQNGSSISKYTISIAGQEKTGTTTGYFTFGKIDKNANQVLSIKAIDSRGFTTTATIPVEIIPHEEPKLVLKLNRRNKFEDRTDIEVSGSYSLLNINGANKNVIQSLTYSYKPKGASTWTKSGQTINFTTNGGTFTGDSFYLDLTNTLAWDFEFSIQDKFVTNTDPTTVGAGQPILFIDSEKKSVGIGVFPVNNDALEIKANFVAQDGFFRGFYGKTLWDYILYDHGNGNVTLSAQGGELYLGYKNTTKIRLSRDIYDYNSEFQLIDTSTSQVNAKKMRVFTDGSDATATTDNHGFEIRQPSGRRIAMDTNEISAFSDGDAPTDLYINPDGGDVSFNNSVGGDLALRISNGYIVNQNLIGISLKNGWINYGGSYQNAGYWKDKNGVVHVEGLIKGGGAGTIFTLPAGYRPEATQIHTHDYSGEHGRIDVYNNGNVNYNGSGSGGWLSLSGLSFKAVN